MSQQPTLYKWVIIGAAFIIALLEGFGAFLEPFLAPSLLESFGLEGGLLLYALILSILAFFGGGVLLGWMSPGETLKEPAYATAIVVIFNALRSLSAQNWDFSLPWLMGILITLVAGFCMTFVGAWLGEKIQGDTTTKMRERGELRG